MKQLKFVVLGVAAMAALWSCASNSAKLSGTLEGVNNGSVVVKLLDVNKMTVLDTLAVKNGSYSCSVPVKAGDPEFVYVYYGPTKVASLILQKGENAKVTSDTLGNRQSLPLQRLFTVQRLPILILLHRRPSSLAASLVRTT